MAISYDRFAELDIRIAKIVEAKPVPGKTRILDGVIDIGSERRSVIIGGAEHYTPEELVGKTVVAIVNLEPKKVAGIESNAMLLAADSVGKPFWLGVSDDVALGTRVR